MACCHGSDGLADRQVVGLLTTADGVMVVVANLLLVVADGGNFYC